MSILPIAIETLKIIKDKNLRQKEACGPKDPRSPFVLSLSDF
jgi:hypothetical protein